MSVEDRVRAGLARRAAGADAGATDRAWEEIQERLGRGGRGGRPGRAATVLAVLVVVAGGIALLSWAFLGHQQATSPTALPTNGRVIFLTTTPSGESSISSVEPDGKALLRIATANRTTQGMSVSADGRRLAYVQGRELPSGAFVDRAVYVIPTSGGERRRIARCPQGCYDLAWSPNGLQIAFIEGPANEARLMVMNSNGGDKRLLCDRRRCGPGLAQPTWSPDGSTIAFSQADVFDLFLAPQVYLPSALYVVHPDGRGLRKLTNTACRYGRGNQGCTSDADQSWTRTGDSLVFMRSPAGAGISDRRRAKGQVDVIGVGGGAPTLLVKCTGANCLGSPAVSPNGRWVAVPGQTGIRLISPAGGTSRLLATCLRTHVCLTPESLAWSPDGRLLAFPGAPSNQNQGPAFALPIYVMRADGAGLHPLGSARASNWLTWAAGPPRAAPPPTSSPVTARDGPIAFVKDLPGGPTGVSVSNLFAVDPDGTGLRDLRSDQAGVSAAAWSPDGTRVVFVRRWATSTSSGPLLHAGVFTMEADGSDMRQLLSCFGYDCPDSFAWAPDDSRIAFIGATGLEVIGADGSNERLLCSFSRCGPELADPSWSPNGDDILVDQAGVLTIPSPGTMPSAIFQVGSDGGTVRKLTNADCRPASGASANCTTDLYPAWSPDGRQIAFVRYQEGRGYQDATLDLMTPSENGVRTLRRTRSGFGPPEWSPTGDRILVAEFAIVTKLDVVAASNGRTVTLPNVCDTSRCPQPQEYVWSPDGREVAFLTQNDSSSALYVVGSTGQGLRRISGSANCCVEWLPAGAVPPAPASSPAAPAAPATARPRLTEGRVAFETGSDVWTIRSDGTRAERLTTTPGFDGEPAWSPGGTRIAFASDRPGEPNTNIFLMNADGSDQRALTNVKDGIGDPTWSPDGRRIAFVCPSGAAPGGEICVMNANGGSVRRLTRSPSGDFDPAWSSRGEIAFLRPGTDGGTTIELMNANGGDVRPLLRIPGSERDLAWSPDGSELAFEWQTAAGRGVYVVGADGGGLRRLIDLPGLQTYPTWSPDGRQIAFVQQGGELAAGIYTIGIDGRGLARIDRPTNGGAFSNLAWGPAASP